MPALSPSELVREDFLTCLEPGTRAAYRYDLTRAEAFFATQGVCLLTAERRHLQRYIGHCQTQGLAARTVARRLAALSGLYRHACADGLLDRSPAASLRRPRLPTDQVRRGLDAGEARLLLATAGQHSTRAHALVSLLLGTGLRITAVCGASVSDLDVGMQVTTLTYRNKGGGRAVTVLSPPVLAAVSAHVAGRASGPLLTTAGPVGRLDRTGAHRLLKQVAAAALPGRRDVSAHTMRSTFAQLALRAGVGLPEVSLALAHRHLASTQPYLDSVLCLQSHPAHAVAEVLQLDPQTSHDSRRGHTSAS